MKKVVLLSSFAFVLLNLTAIGCTTFLLEKNGQLVFGRNYDWVTGTGMVNTNLRGQVKQSLPLEKNNTIQWTSKYGSITFNQYGKEFPNGGMNEKGLVIELMWLNESQYPSPDNRPAFNVLQWIQYQLDNSATIDEVIATDKRIRIASTGTPQHYLIADASGNAATIEFLNGKMTVHAGKNLPYPVLANSTYDASLNLFKPYSNPKDRRDRFSKVCTMLEKYRANTTRPVVDYSFDILKEVAQDNFTKWSIVYDISSRKIYFKTDKNQQVKFLDFNAFNFTCNSRQFTFNMNQDASGNISKQFAAYSNDINRKMLKAAFIESKEQINIPDELQEAAAAVASSVKCG